MDRRTFVIAAGSLAAGCTTDRAAVPVAGRQRGIALDAFRARPSGAHFAAIRRLGATHLALFPFGFMRSHTEPAVHRYDGERTDWSLTDQGLLMLGWQARVAGLRVIVLPTLVDFVDGHWRGEVEMASGREWTEWFESYRGFVNHYADLAQQMQAVGFSVGTELRMTTGRTREWRRTIGDVRERFRGWLTYAANWDDYETVPWWSAIDLVGVQAYFELGDPPADGANDRRAQLAEAWGPIKQRLAAHSRATGRRVLFTEIGYKSHGGSTAQPWQWEIEGDADPELQAAAYEAAFETFWSEPWFAGFYWWKWHPDPEGRRDHERDFTPQGKPAEAVLRRWYTENRLTADS